MPEGVNDQFGNNLREPVSEVAQSNTDNLQNKYFNVNLGATFNITKDWDVQVDYIYDHQTTDKNTSVIEYSGGQTWYTPSEWIDENGQQVYVDANGNQVPAGTEGAMHGFRVP